MRVEPPRPGDVAPIVSVAVHRDLDQDQVGVGPVRLEPRRGYQERVGAGEKGRREQERRHRHSGLAEGLTTGRSLRPAQSWKGPSYSLAVTPGVRAANQTSVACCPT